VQGLRRPDAHELLEQHDLGLAREVAPADVLGPGRRAPAALREPPAPCRADPHRALLVGAAADVAPLGREVRVEPGAELLAHVIVLGAIAHTLATGRGTGARLCAPRAYAAVGATVQSSP